MTRIKHKYWTIFALISLFGASSLANGEVTFEDAEDVAVKSRFERARTKVLVAESIKFSKMPTTISLISSNLTIGLPTKTKPGNPKTSWQRNHYSLLGGNFMSHIRLIISDIDGTILNDLHQIDSDLLTLIPDLKREEIPFCSGLCSFSQRDGSYCQRARYRRLPHGLLQRGLDSKGRAGSV